MPSCLRSRGVLPVVIDPAVLDGAADPRGLAATLRFTRAPRTPGLDPSSGDSRGGHGRSGATPRSRSSPRRKRSLEYRSRRHWFARCWAQRFSPRLVRSLTTPQTAVRAAKAAISTPAWAAPVVTPSAGHLRPGVTPSVVTLPGASLPVVTLSAVPCLPRPIRRRSTRTGTSKTGPSSSSCSFRWTRARISSASPRRAAATMVGKGKTASTARGTT